MGLIVQNYTTEQGFLVPELYIQVSCIRMLKTSGGNAYGMLYSTTAYKSLADRDSGNQPITIPSYLANIEQFLKADEFYEQTIFGFAYDAIKLVWQNAGYVVTDFYAQPPTPKTYIYDCSGYSFQGYNCAGYDKDGYDKQGFNKDGFNRAGYDKDGFDKDGWDFQGYGRDGYNAAGYDRQGYDREGYDKNGYDKSGFDRQGCNIEGKDKDGNPCPAAP